MKVILQIIYLLVPTIVIKKTFLLHNYWKLKDGKSKDNFFIFLKNAGKDKYIKSWMYIFLPIIKIDKKTNFRVLIILVNLLAFAIISGLVGILIYKFNMVS